MKDWKATPQSQRGTGNAAYADMMAAELKAVRRERPRIQILDRSKMSREEYDAAILAMQPASTRRAMLETPEEKAKRHADLSTITVEFASANKDAKSIEELVPLRDISPAEFDSAQRARKKSKNTLGQSEASAFTPERREAAASAFTCSPPAELAAPDKANLDKVLGYGKPPVVPTAPEPPKAKTERKPFAWWLHDTLRAMGLKA